jgi:hypothetical protein
MPQAPNSLCIYFSLTPLIGGMRLDEKIDLCVGTKLCPQNQTATVFRRVRVDRSNQTPQRNSLDRSTTKTRKLSLPTRTINRTSLKAVRLGANTQATKKTPRLLKLGTHTIIEIRPDNRRTMFDIYEMLRKFRTQLSIIHHHIRLLKFVIPIVELIR